MTRSDLASLLATTSPLAAPPASAPKALGRLGELMAWLAAAQGDRTGAAPRRPRLVLAGAQRPDAGIGVRALAAGTVAQGVDAADHEVESGTDLVLLSGAGDAVSCALAVCALTGVEPVAVLPRGAAAIDSAAWVARAEQLLDRRPALIALRDDPDALLEAIGDGILAAATGLLASLTARRTPVVLDGDLALTAALVVARLHADAAGWWQVADTSASPLARAVLPVLDRRPLLDLGIATDDGTAALVVLAAITAVSTRTGKAPS